MTLLQSSGAARGGCWRWRGVPHRHASRDDDRRICWDEPCWDARRRMGCRSRAAQHPRKHPRAWWGHASPWHAPAVSACRHMRQLRIRGKGATARNARTEGSRPAAALATSAGGAASLRPSPQQCRAEMHRPMPRNYIFLLNRLRITTMFVASLYAAAPFRLQAVELGRAVRRHFDSTAANPDSVPMLPLWGGTTRAGHCAASIIDIHTCWASPAVCALWPE